VAEVVECLPSNSEALSSSPSTTKNNNKKVILVFNDSETKNPGSLDNSSHLEAVLVSSAVS
jgi:hypothetical protein